MDEVTNKEILETTKADYLLSTDFWSQKERASSYPVQGYRQEKPEAERHKDDSWTSFSSKEINGEQ